jgi:hypothetical protein
MRASDRNAAYPASNAVHPVDLVGKVKGSLRLSGMPVVDSLG